MTETQTQPANVETLQLKPCPFCGGEASYGGLGDETTVHCDSDDCRAYVVVGPCETLAEAARIWNERPGENVAAARALPPGRN